MSKIRIKNQTKYSPAIRAAIISSAVSAGLLLSSGSAQDWPRWGGNDPGRNMYSPVKNLPDHFVNDKSGKINLKPGKEPGMESGPEERAEREVGGEPGFAGGNVVVAGGKVFIGTNEHPRDPRPQRGDRSILLCLDEKTGDYLWQLVIPSRRRQVNDWENYGAALFSVRGGKSRLFGHQPLRGDLPGHRGHGQRQRTAPTWMRRNTW